MSSLGLGCDTYKGWGECTNEGVSLGVAQEEEEEDDERKLSADQLIRSVWSVR